ncbi:hypothetical protein LOTGIDRAFT_236299 [Lottia gigantea]|uniref:TNFR-Cys domain-containing protein n=1 Tax=Lottia gigantea TaxID=225164 RepID=V3ZTV6_LOTGI|nr:hypothetical protein LOTGIDRAFT_236299 [Lottia gigantea]ESO84331.1 hypothetical protein LOTGIDRAFT_236299 [Lottia gigantea]
MAINMAFLRVLFLLFSIYKVKGGDMCPPGTHCIANCKVGNNQPECQDCPRGTFSTKENIASYCEVCRDTKCPRGTVFKDTCTSTTDNRCDCKDGSYMVRNIGSQYGKCIMHKTCKNNEVVIKNGTATEDTQCGPKPTDPTTTTGQDEKESTISSEHHPGTDGYTTSTQIPKDNDEADEGSSELTGVQVLAILITIVVVVVILPIVIYFYCCQNQADDNRVVTTTNEVRKKRKRARSNKLKNRKSTTL